MWLVKISTNGRYILAPNVDGKIFIWNLKSTEKVAVMGDSTYYNNVKCNEILGQGGTPVRDVLFHPTRKLMFACADGKHWIVY
jgi:hypothetical protein